MACFHPVPGYRTDSGDVVMVERGSIVGGIPLPCGNCVGCRLERARQWTIRVMHESRMHDTSCFVTLTYDDGDLPPGGSLFYPHFQLFMKRLRKERGPTRFYMCGEYGDDLGRPHYHSALFGLDFREDRYSWRTTSAGAESFRSSSLERLWPHGNCEVSDLTPASAAYIARYVMKKVNGGRAEEHYRRVDVETGEVTQLEPEFTHMSLKPGIGSGWFDRYHGDVYPHDRVVLKGKASKPPRYYDLRLKRMDRELFERMKDSREEKAGINYLDNTLERLRDKEQVAAARLKFYRRGL